MFAPEDRFRGHGIKARLLNPYDAFWDQRLGVHTFGFHPATGKQGDADWRVHYTATPYSDIFHLLRLVNLREDDVFVDLGSGLGRAVFAASWMGARRAIGVEVVPDLCDRAEQNLRRSRLIERNIEFTCMHALNYQHRDTTVLFMFHPFGEETMRRVLLNIFAIRHQDSSRRLRIIYMNPVFDFVLEHSGWLECVTRLPPPTRWLSTTNSYVTSVWQSVALGSAPIAKAR
jgi:predicted RNA methylase